ncbi:hypothetical protein B5C34_14940 [Pacificimonas flava]|uniref:TonB-dependent receptor n=2 Tax=Pacificimonas TaxID=1960290 RepID=A0A219B0R1_9SPHN|nr:hypothetical protein B5C34_14940 [Pacificimonas flava]
MLSLWSGAAFAQEVSPPPPTPDATSVPSPDATAPDPLQADGRRTFTPADFVQFAPRTALDMVRRIPGFSIDQVESRRGLGQATSNVLINGERISGKSNGPVDALSRIPAGNVIRLEIVDGASLDVPGLSGQVLNAVTRAGRVSGQWRWSPQFRTSGTQARLGSAEISVAGGGAKTDWTLSLENQANRSGNAGTEYVTTGSGVLIDTREEKGTYYGDRPILSGAYTYRADNGNILNLNAEGQLYWFRGDEISLRSGSIDVDRTRSFFEREEEYNYELGGDYEFALLGGRLKLIGLRRYENSKFRFGLDQLFADGSPPDGERYRQQANEAETIARAEYSWTGLGGEFQLSAEAAKNILDIESDLERLDGDGVYVPVALDGSDDRVEEERGETLLSHSRALSPAFQIQAVGGVEYSRLSQVGAGGQVRTFWRPKGSVSLDWDAGPRLDLSAKLERKVGQLDFYDFIAGVNINDDREDVTNANLVPPQSWLLEVEGTRDLGAFGSVTLSLFGEAIEDIVDQIPIDGGGEAPGNAGKATRYGVELDGTFLSEPLGWPGTRLELYLNFRETDVDDPLTGLGRPISDELQTDVEVSLRHDFAGSDWAVGGGVYYEQYSPYERLTERSIFTNAPFPEFFIENKDVMGLTLRGTVGNAFDLEENAFRTIYADKEAGLIDRREDRYRTFGTVFTLTIEGSF